jgi:hypothetical protein
MTQTFRTLVMLLAMLWGAGGCSHAPVDYRQDHPPVRDDEMAQWSGHPMAEVVKLWGPPRSIVQLEERRLEYRYPRPDIDASCVHFWVVNRQGFIIGHRHEGHCTP